LVNSAPLRKQLENEGLEFVSNHSDTEVMLRIIQKHFDEGIEKGVREIFRLVRGAFSCVMLTQNSLVAFRDAQGIRPLSLGMINNETYVVSSETCGLDAVGAEFVREIEPGEMIIINENGVQSYNINQHQKKGLCSFEYIYFSRPDSMMEGDSIYKFRELSGKKIMGATSHRSRCGYWRSRFRSPCSYWLFKCFRNSFQTYFIKEQISWTIIHHTFTGNA